MVKKDFLGYHLILVMMKKAQLIEDYITAYWWIMLIVIIAVASFISYSVFFVNGHLPEKCNLLRDFSCSEISGENGSVSFIVRNDGEFDVNNVNIGITGFVTASCHGNSSMARRAQNLYTCRGNFSKGGFEGDIMINYTNTNTHIEHIKRGSLAVNIKDAPGQDGLSLKTIFPSIDKRPNILLETSIYSVIILIIFLAYISLRGSKENPN